jgi:hypothetical protein
MSRRLIWFLGLLSLTPVLLQAQGSSVGSITGSVIEPSGSAVPGHSSRFDVEPIRLTEVLSTLDEVGDLIDSIAFRQD